MLEREIKFSEQDWQFIQDSAQRSNESIDATIHDIIKTFCAVVEKAETDQKIFTAFLAFFDKYDEIAETLFSQCCAIDDRLANSEVSVEVVLHVLDKQLQLMKEIGDSHYEMQIDLMRVMDEPKLLNTILKAREEFDYWFVKRNKEQAK